MKTKKQKANLEARISAWSKLGAKDQAAHKKPGSQKK